MREILKPDIGQIDFCSSLHPNLCTRKFFYEEKFYTHMNSSQNLHNQ